MNTSKTDSTFCEMPTQAPVGTQSSELPPGATRSFTVLPRTVPTDAGLQLVTPRKPRYEVVKRLGEGAFGEVALAQDNDIERAVAIKRIRVDRLDPDTLSRFVSEVQSVGRLEHPGIIPVHDVGLDDRGYFFVMKYVDGETLESIIAKLRRGDRAYHAKYTMEYRTQLFLQLCRAVQFAHARGFVHRDIKPANIMVGRFGEVVLMDWGLAKEVGVAEVMGAHKPTAPGEYFGTMLGHALGTPAYMAPEQARGEHDRTDGRSDVYSLCAVFFELLALRHYLDTKPTVEALLQAVKTEEPVSAIAMHHRYQVSPELAWLVRKGLEKDPALRYQTVEELCDRLQAALEGAGPVMCPCTALKRANGSWSDFIDRHPVLAVVAAVFGVVFALVGLGVTVYVVAASFGH